jgi:hypothetical protein
MMLYKLWSLFTVIVLILVSCSAGKSATSTGEDAAARIVFFYSENCSRCFDLYNELIQPLIDRCPTSLDVKAVQADTPQGAKVLTETEQKLIGDTGRWESPIVVVGDTYFIGEDAIRSGLLPHLECVFGEGGNDWPDVPSLLSYHEENELSTLEDAASKIDSSPENCVSDEALAVCVMPEPIFVLFFTTENCGSTCDNLSYDIRYLKGLFPQILYETMAYEENQSLARAIIEDMGIQVPGDELAPAIVVGTDYLTGDALNLDNLKAVFSQYGENGTKAFWYMLDVD